MSMKISNIIYKISYLIYQISYNLNKISIYLSVLHNKYLMACHTSYIRYLLS